MVFRKAAGWSSLRNGVFLPYDALQQTGTVALSPSLPESEPIAFSIIDGYDSQANLAAPAAPMTFSQTTPIAGFGPNGALAMALNGVVLTAAATRNNTPWTQVAADDLILIGYEPPLNPIEGELGGVVANINATYQFRNDPAEPPSGGTGCRHGARWASMSPLSIRDGSWTGNPLTALAAGAYGVRAQFSPSNIAGRGTAKVGPIIRITQRRKPIFMLSFDDGYQRELTDVVPRMVARFGSAPGTSYVPMGLIGTAERYTLSDMAAMKAAGWTFSINSGRSDEPIWSGHGGGIADAIASLNTERAALVATGLATVEEASHVCYSFGTTSPNETIVSTLANCVANGTTTITSTNTFHDVGAMRGVVIKAPGVPAGTTIVSCSRNAIVVNQPVPSGTYTLAFCCVAAIGTNGGLVANGTTTITSVRTDGLIVGMTMQGRDVPVPTTITAINTESTGTTANGTITVSNPVPATCTRAGFFIAGAPWLAGNIENALISAGYLTGRRVQGDGRFCSQFGIPSAMAMMSLTGLSVDQPKTAAASIAAIAQAIRDGRDTLAYMHAAPATDIPTLEAILDYVKTRVDAGELDVMSVPAWYNRIAARSGVA